MNGGAGERLGWDPDGGWIPAPTAVGAPTVVDSCLSVDGSVRAFDAHARRFTRAVGDRAAPVLPLLDPFLAAVRERTPAAGRWFPRVELVEHSTLALRVRPAPPVRSAVRLWCPEEPDRRREPTTKGPDLPYLGAVRDAAVAAGGDEALLLAPDGRVVEGSTTSIVWWRDDTLCLPPMDAHRLPGVTRELVTAAARACGTAVSVEEARPADLTGREVWALNALHGVRPVVAWPGAPFRPGPAVRATRWRAHLDATATTRRRRCAGWP